MLRFDSKMLKEKMVDVLNTEGLNDVSIKHLTDSMISTAVIESVHKSLSNNSNWESINAQI